MNKNILIAIVVLLILIFVGGGYVMMMQKNKSPLDKEGVTTGSQKQNTSSEKPKESSAEELSLSGNIFDLINRGDKLMCTFSSDTDGSKSSGRMYISGQKVRGDFNVEIESQTIESHMITDGDYVYTWSSSMPQGIKMKISEEDKASADLSEANSTKNLKDLQKDYDYKCSKWSEDSSKFNVPTNIEFADMSETVEKLQKGGTDMCATCDMISDATQKAQCRASLNCE